jgi:putative phosphoribosyl transferase
MAARFANRASAGAELGRLVLDRGIDADAVVLGLPRGGVPVAAAVADVLHAPLDVLVVAKLGVPSQPELAFGAVASGDVRWLNDEVVTAARLPAPVVEQLSAIARAAVHDRARRLRADRNPVSVTDRSMVLVDDGIATGATMRVAVEAARLLGAGRVIVAAPVATPDVVIGLSRIADRVDVLEISARFGAVSLFYDDFRQTTEAEVALLLSGRAGPAVAH